MEMKEKDRMMRMIFRRYRRSQFLIHTLHERDVDASDYLKIEFALSCLAEDQRFLLEKEYLDTNDRHWWMDYYSKSTYYRLKNRAIDEMLMLLK